MEPAATLQLNNATILAAAVSEISIVVYTYPSTGSSLRAGRLATAAWHMQCSSDVKVVVRIADIDEFGKLQYNSTGVALYESIKAMIGFDRHAYELAEAAISAEQEGRFICWRK